MTTLRNQMLSATAHRALHNAMETNRHARPPAPKHSYVIDKEGVKVAIAEMKSGGVHAYVETPLIGRLEMIPTRGEL